MKKFLLAVIFAVTTSLVAPSVSSAGLFGRSEPKGAHDKNARGLTKNKHQEANARRAREQAAAAKRHAEASKASARRQQAAKQAKAAAKRQGGRGGRR